MQVIFYMVRSMSSVQVVMLVDLSGFCVIVWVMRVLVLLKLVHPTICLRIMLCMLIFEQWVRWLIQIRLLLFTISTPKVFLLRVCVVDIWIKMMVVNGGWMGLINMGVM